MTGGYSGILLFWLDTLCIPPDADETMKMRKASNRVNAGHVRQCRNGTSLGLLASCKYLPRGVARGDYFADLHLHLELTALDLPGRGLGNHPEFPVCQRAYDLDKEIGELTSPHGVSEDPIIKDGFAIPPETPPYRSEGISEVVER